MPTRPLLLDLFCGAGGAATGYHRAGFEVVGVDIDPQPNYPFEFIQGNALDVLLTMSDYGEYRIASRDGGTRVSRLAHRGWDAIHTSPPCQAYTAYRRKGHGVGDGYPDLIGVVRDRLQNIRIPYVIENVKNAPLDDPVKLCGSMFGLDVQRHRLFESNCAWLEQPECDHAAQRAKGKKFPGATNRKGRFTCEIGAWRIPLETQKRAMGVDWNVTLKELSEMVPPAYTEYLGRQFAAWTELKDAA